MFNLPRKSFIILALLLLILALSALPAYAITATSISITGGTDTMLDCGRSLNNFHINVTAGNITGTANDVSGQDEFFIAIIDGTGKFVGSWIDKLPVGATQTFSVATGNWDTVLGMSLPASRLVRAVLFDSPDVDNTTLQAHLNDTPLFSTGWFDIGSLSAACAALPTIPQAPVTPLINNVSTLTRPDSRINWQYGDLNAVIYDHEDGVVVYCYANSAWLGMHITQALVADWDHSLPQDTALLEVDEAGCHVAFYILDTGEYQINIWAAEGKRYEVIADNLDFTNAEMHTFDPNE